jgi:alpha-D-xyloside xylohydrolase
VGEKPQDPITLYVYAGADVDFTLYEDDGLTYAYEKGAYSEIPIHWDDASSALTLGDRNGRFDGMLDKRTFNVVLVSKKNPVGFSFEPKAKQVVEYSGEKTVVSFGQQ